MGGWASTLEACSTSRSWTLILLLVLVLGISGETLKILFVEEHRMGIILLCRLSGCVWAYHELPSTEMLRALRQTADAQQLPNPDQEHSTNTCSCMMLAKTLKNARRASQHNMPLQ